MTTKDRMTSEELSEVLYDNYCVIKVWLLISSVVVVYDSVL